MYLHSSCYLSSLANCELDIWRGLEGSPGLEIYVTYHARSSRDVSLSHYLEKSNQLPAGSWSFTWFRDLRHVPCSLATWRDPFSFRESNQLPVKTSQPSAEDIASTSQPFTQRLAFSHPPSNLISALSPPHLLPWSSHSPTSSPSEASTTRLNQELNASPRLQHYLSPRNEPTSPANDLSASRWLTRKPRRS